MRACGTNAQTIFCQGMRRNQRSQIKSIKTAGFYLENKAGISSKTRVLRSDRSAFEILEHASKRYRKQKTASFTPVTRNSELSFDLRQRTDSRIMPRTYGRLGRRKYLTGAGRKIEIPFDPERRMVEWARNFENLCSRSGLAGKKPLLARQFFCTRSVVVK